MKPGDIFTIKVGSTDRTFVAIKYDDKDILIKDIELDYKQDACFLVSSSILKRYEVLWGDGMT